MGDDTEKRIDVIRRCLKEMPDCLTSQQLQRMNVEEVLSDEKQLKRVSRMCAEELKLDEKSAGFPFA